MNAAQQAAHDAARLFRLTTVDGLPDAERVRRIAADVLASGRRARFAIAAGLVRLLKRDAARRVAEVDSAAPLDADTRAAIEIALIRRYKHAMAATFLVDPALIGGVRVSAAGEVYDDSIRARLHALETPA